MLREIKSISLLGMRQFYKNPPWKMYQIISRSHIQEMMNWWELWSHQSWGQQRDSSQSCSSSYWGVWVWEYQPVIDIPSHTNTVIMSWGSWTSPQSRNCEREWVFIFINNLFLYKNIKCLYLYLLLYLFIYFVIHLCLYSFYQIWKT